MLAFNPTQSRADFLQKSQRLQFVNPFDCGEQAEVNPKLRSHRTEGGQVLGKTGTSIPDSRMKELGSNALVHTDPWTDFSDIRSHRFAEVGDGVDKGDFH